MRNNAHGIKMKAIQQCLLHDLPHNYSEMCDRNIESDMCLLLPTHQYRKTVMEMRDGLLSNTIFTSLRGYENGTDR